MDKKRIIVTSRGLNGKVGRRAIKSALKQCLGEKYGEYLADKTIMLCTIEEYGVDELLIESAIALGFQKENIVIWNENISREDKSKFKTFSFCYVSEGNTFQIAQMLRLTGADSVIQKSISQGGFYIGASAGAILAGNSIKFAKDFDTNFVRLTDFEGLNLLPASLGKAVLIPHYNKKQFLRWKKNTPAYLLEEFDYIDYIPDTKYKLF